MRIISTVFAFIGLAIALCGLYAQAPVWADCQTAGNDGGDHPSGIAVDNEGNQYVVGSMLRTCTFGSITLTNFGLTDVYVAKLDPDGNWLWAVHSGGPGDDYGTDITVDDAENIYVTGAFDSTAVFGAYTLVSSGGSDIFISKLDTNGNWLWAVKGGGVDTDSGQSIAVNGSGGVWVTGNFHGPAVFGTHSLTSVGDTADIFVARLNQDGTYSWVSHAGSIGTNNSVSIAVDESGNSWIGAHFWGTLNFFFVGFFTSIYSDGLSDGLVAKLDPNGTWLWSSRVGGASGCNLSDIAVNGSGSVWVSGFFYEDAIFGSITLTSEGSRDVFAAKMDGSGTWLWASGGGSPEMDEGMQIACDIFGNSYLTGYYKAPAVFGSINLPYVGDNTADNLFVLRLDQSGNYLWGLNSTGPHYEHGSGIAVSEETSSAWICGSFYAIIYLDGFSASYPYNAATVVARIDHAVPVPQAPQGLVMQMDVDTPGVPPGYTFLLNWDPVNMDTGGFPITPWRYEVWANYDGDPYGVYESLAQIESLSYMGYFPYGRPTPEFFRVTAVMSDVPQ
jgi:hypothetical protein